MPSLWQEIRMLTAGYLLRLVIFVAPAKHPDGLRLGRCILAYLRPDLIDPTDHADHADPPP